MIGVLNTSRDVAKKPKEGRPNDGICILMLAFGCNYLQLYAYFSTIFQAELFKL